MRPWCCGIVSSRAKAPTKSSRTDALEWVYVGDDSAGDGPSHAGSVMKGAGKSGPGGVVDDLWRVWRGRKIDEVLAGSLLDVVVGQAGRGGGDLRG